MPIAENFKIPKEERKSYPPLPENIYQVELLDVTSEIKPKYESAKQKAEREAKGLPLQNETMLKFQFTLLAGTDKEGSPLRGRNVWRNFVPASLYIGKNGKNALYQIIEAILKHELTPEQEATMEASKLNALIGHQLRIGIKNKVVNDKTYSNVEVFYPIEAPLPRLTDEEKDKAMTKQEAQDEAPQEQQGEPTAEEINQFMSELKETPDEDAKIAQTVDDMPPF